jgi:hypothetical protein
VKIGKDTVIIGNVPSNLEAGDGSVVIGATDAQGNTIINEPMVVGRNASAGPHSIAIGAGANAGAAFNLAAAIHELSALAQQANDSNVQGQLAQISSEPAKPQPNRSAISKAWEVVKAAGSIGGAHALLAKISAAIAVL